MATEHNIPNESILPDDYPVYADYLYVADGRVVRSNWHGITAREFRLREGLQRSATLLTLLTEG